MERGPAFRPIRRNGKRWPCSRRDPGRRRAGGGRAARRIPFGPGRGGRPRSGRFRGPAVRRLADPGRYGRDGGPAAVRGTAAGRGSRPAAPPFQHPRPARLAARPSLRDAGRRRPVRHRAFGGQAG
ncbi:hypothetical protein C8077_05010 [Bifidobacterium adolescentis]|uniref:Uncharacterized protein n=1 Tax=Bifidobacterium adolescentis TaxID=1680 RepID=A0A2R4G3E7_BIFAD|nr:hypothetical protein C8077_05010 [Bifidobacterium adolescentis]